MTTQQALCTASHLPNCAMPSSVEQNGVLLGKRVIQMKEGTRSKQKARSGAAHNEEDRMWGGHGNVRIGTCHERPGKAL